MCLPGGTQMPGNVRKWAARCVSNTRPSLDSRINAQPTSTPRSLVDSDNCDVNEGFSEWTGQNAGLYNSNTNVLTCIIITTSTLEVCFKWDALNKSMFTLLYFTLLHLRVLSINQSTYTKLVQVLLNSTNGILQVLLSANTQDGIPVV